MLSLQRHGMVTISIAALRAALEHIAASLATLVPLCS